LVGGLPYIDVVIDPVGLTTAPFYDPDSGSDDGGPGLDTGLGAPGANKLLWPVHVDCFPSAGDRWADGPAQPYLFWGDTSTHSVSTEGVSQFQIIDRLDDNLIVEVGAFSPNRIKLEAGDNGSPPHIVFITDQPSRAVNQPLVMATHTDITGGGTSFGTRSIRYRIYYQILDVTPFANEFFHIININQGSKTIRVNGDDSALSGAISIVGSTGNDGDYTVSSATLILSPSHAITAVDQGTKTFTVAGDQTSDFPSNSIVQVTGSTGNDGVYGIISSTFVTDHTDIVVVQPIPNATADGHIGIAVTDVVTVEAIPDSTADGWVKQ